MPVLTRGAMRALMTALSVALLGSALVVTPAAAAGSVSFSTALSGYSDPVLVTAPRGSSRTIFIVERVGRIRVATYSNGSYHKAGTFLDIRSRVKSTFGEQGLLGLAFDPDYASNRRFYVNYTRKNDGDTVVAEYRRSSSSSIRANAGSVRQVIRPSTSRTRTTTAACSRSGRTTTCTSARATAASAGDPSGNARRTGTACWARSCGCARTAAAAGRYTIPSSNPFVGRTGLDLIWSYGLRNPWRWSFDRSNGDLWIGDVGQEPVRGGQPRTRAAGVSTSAGTAARGSSAIPTTALACTTGKRPLKVYSHGSSHCSVTGGYAYRGPDFNGGWQGKYIYGDYCSGHVWVINKSGSTLISRDTGYNISSFGEDGAGRLFMVDLGGQHPAGRLQRHALITARSSRSQLPLTSVNVSTRISTVAVQAPVKGIAAVPTQPWWLDVSGTSMAAPSA